MENLPEKRQETSLSIHTYKPGTKAVEVRREMAKIPEVSKMLKGTDRMIFGASIKESIEEIDPKALTHKVTEVLKLICIDVGLKRPNGTEWDYLATRISSFIYKHYGKLSLTEFKLAFELASSGELNDYLPKDRNGEPDKNHYQNLSIDYVGKILNAYKAKQGEVIHKAIKAIPAPEVVVSEAKQQEYKNNVRNACLNAFSEYKEKNTLNIQGLVDMFLYKWLKDNGIAEDLQPTISDREEAHEVFLFKMSVGIINKYSGASVRNEGIKSRDLDHDAEQIAKKRAIKDAFDKIIKENIDINQLKF